MQKCAPIKKVIKKKGREMKIVKFFLIVIISFILNVQSKDILIYKNQDQDFDLHYQFLSKIFLQFNIKTKTIEDINTNDDDNLHIIFNPISVKDFPKFYIIYQTQELHDLDISNDFINKLSRAVAVWDYKWENINKYSSILSNYYYFPENYEFADPVILPCLLPIKALETYKEILRQSNTINWAASSLLPIIFTHCLLKEPKTIIEFGVSSVGTSSAKEILRQNNIINWATPGFLQIIATHCLLKEPNVGTSFAFYKAGLFSDAQIIGVDTQEIFRNTYNNFKNSKFLCINDLDFPKYYNSLDFKADVIFIDTTHTYFHTMDEIETFVPYLAKDAILLFHGSNVTPLNNYTTYYRLNNSYGSAPGNPRGVANAIKDYFSLEFDENKYYNFEFIKNNIKWKFIHYPFCNGLTILKKMDN